MHHTTLITIQYMGIYGNVSDIEISSMRVYSEYPTNDICDMGLEKQKKDMHLLFFNNRIKASKKELID